MSARKAHWSFSIARTLFSIARVAVVGLAFSSVISHVPVVSDRSTTTIPVAGVVYVKKSGKYVPWDGSAGMVTYCRLQYGKRTVYAVRDTDVKLAA